MKTGHSATKRGVWMGSTSFQVRGSAKGAEDTFLIERVHNFDEFAEVMKLPEG